MAHKAPGKAHREGITLVELMDMFPNEVTATAWFESVFWGGERHCGHCGSARTYEGDGGNGMPYRCGDCRGYFSVKTGTVMAHSKVPLRKWAIAIYLCLTSLKSVSSMKLHRDIGVSQPTAWFMLHRIREAWTGNTSGPFDGPVEVDETYFGGKRKNMSKAKRKELAGTGRGAVGKTAVVGMKDRDSNKVTARVVDDTDGQDIAGVCRGSRRVRCQGLHGRCSGSYKGHVLSTTKPSNIALASTSDGMAHTNGIESFWSMLKRAHKGTFHKISPKHLDRYVSGVRWQA